MMTGVKSKSWIAAVVAEDLLGGRDERPSDRVEIPPRLVAKQVLAQFALHGADAGAFGIKLRSVEDLKMREGLSVMQMTGACFSSGENIRHNNHESHG